MHYQRDEAMVGSGKIQACLKQYFGTAKTTQLTAFRPSRCIHMYEKTANRGYTPSFVLYSSIVPAALVVNLGLDFCNNA
jgi:hypothetical protein